MTLIIGILCSDGIVVGADGAATLGAMGQYTVRQPVKKLSIIGPAAVVGVSGPIGLGQRIKGVVSQLWEDKKFSGGSGGKPPKPHMAMTLVREEIWKHIGQEISVAQAAGQLLGQVAVQSAVSASLLAIPLGNELCLFSFDQQGAPEQATSDLPFVAIGSGQKSADPFLAFIRRILWPNRQPSLAEGTFAAYWALDYAIKGDPGGVDEPKQLITVSRTGGTFKATELTENDLEEHQQSMNAAHAALRAFRDGLATTAGEKTVTTTPPPEPPQSTSK